MSGRGVAREAGFTHRACSLALAKLETIGLIDRQGSGKTQLVRLNFEHLLVKEALLPMFAAEKRAMTSLRSFLRKEFEGETLAATLFGSVARREEEPGSDVDLLLVIERGSKSRLLSKSHALGDRLAQRYGMRLSPIVRTFRELRALHHRSDPLLKTIISEGVDLLPTRLEDVLR